jgi:adenylylsulfate kinase
MISETRQRSLLKALSWRIVIFITDFTIVYLLTRKIEFASTFAVIKFFLGIILYFLHERGWNRIHWGRKEVSTPKT